MSDLTGDGSAEHDETTDAAPDVEDTGTEAEPTSLEPPQDAPPAAAAQDAVVEAEVEPEVPVETSEAAAEQIEWQPVVEGDTIEWRPVYTSDAVAGHDEAADIQAEAQPDFEYPDGTELETPWEPGVTDATSPVVGNGAASADTAGAAAGAVAGAAGAGAGAAAAAAGPSRRPTPPRRPPGRPPAARRPAVEDEPDPDQPDDRRAASKTKRQVIVLSVLTVLVIGVAVLGFVLSRDAKEKGTQATTPDGSALPSNTVPRLPDSALQTYSDQLTGFTVKFAKTWEILRAPNADIRLVVNAGGNDGFQVRVAPIQTPATTENIGNFKAVTDAVVFGDKTAKSVKEQLVTVNGHLAYYYLFTFHDPVSNTEGVHAQYFVFEGNRMFVLTFQTVPADEFAKQANLWDQVAESFTVQPRPNTTSAPPAETTTSTTVP